MAVPQEARTARWQSEPLVRAAQKRTVWLLAAAQIGVGVGVASSLGPLLALMELFPASVRTTSYSIGFNIGLAIFGGAGPLLVAALIASTGDPGIPVYYVMGSALVTALRAIYLAETRSIRARN